MSGIDYGLLATKFIDFVPDGELAMAFATDYALMRKDMIYGDSPEPDDLFERIRALQEKFRNSD